MNARWLVLALLSLSSLAGCPMPSMWTTPRTIPQGMSTHTIGVETLAFVGREEADLNEDGDTADAFEDSGVVVAPFVFPAYIFRMGLGDTFDLGLKGSTGGAFIADFKWQLIKTPAFDMALDPSVQVSIINYVALPLMMALNMGEPFSIYFGPRATWVFILGADDSTVAGGIAVGGTLGFRIAAGNHFTIYPEVNWLRSLAADSNGHMATIGLGFSFGTGQPDYGPGSIAYEEGGE